MNDHPRTDPADDDERFSPPDPDQDRWSAWLPELDPTADRTPPPHAAGPDPITPPPRPQPSQPSQPNLPHLPHLPPPQPSRVPSGYRWGTPLYGAPTAPGPPPKTYLPVAIIVTILGFMPFGVVAIIMALSVNSRWAKGDWDGARRASRAARAWAVAGVIAGLLFVLASSLFAGVASSSSG